MLQSAMKATLETITTAWRMHAPFSIPSDAPALRLLSARSTNPNTKQMKEVVTRTMTREKATMKRDMLSHPSP